MPQILVVVDHDNGSPRKVSNQILTAARAFGDVSAAVFGEGASGAAEALGKYGVSKVYVWDSPDATGYATEPVTQAIVTAVEQSGATIVLAPTDPFISDSVARAAIRLKGGV